MEESKLSQPPQKKVASLQDCVDILQEQQDQDSSQDQSDDSSNDDDVNMSDDDEDVENGLFAGLNQPLGTDENVDMDETETEQQTTMINTVAPQTVKQE